MQPKNSASECFITDTSAFYHVAIVQTKQSVSCFAGPSEGLKILRQVVTQGPLIEKVNHLLLPKFGGVGLPPTQPSDSDGPVTLLLPCSALAARSIFFFLLLKTRYAICIHEGYIQSMFLLASILRSCGFLQHTFHVHIPEPSLFFISGGANT